MPAIINLTRHPLTVDQALGGVGELPEEGRAMVAELLTFDDIPTAADITNRADRLAALAARHGEGGAAMVAGATFLIPALCQALRARGIEPVFAFSLRVHEDRLLPDGTVEAVSRFRHLGFVRPFQDPHNN